MKHCYWEGIRKTSHWYLRFNDISYIGKAPAEVFAFWQVLGYIVSTSRWCFCPQSFKYNTTAYLSYTMAAAKLCAKKKQLQCLAVAATVFDQDGAVDNKELVHVLQAGQQVQGKGWQSCALAGRRNSAHFQWLGCSTKDAAACAAALFWSKNVLLHAPYVYAKQKMLSLCAQILGVVTDTTLFFTDATVLF